MSSIGPISPDSAAAMRFHHVGIVVQAIDACIERFCEQFLAAWDGRIIHDPLQDVHVAFLYTGDDRTRPALELVEPASESSPVSRFLQNRVALHHLCYEVPDLDAAIRRIVATGSLVVRKPVPAVAFDGRSIAWLMTRDRILVELLQQ